MLSSTLMNRVFNHIAGGPINSDKIGQPSSEDICWCPGSLKHGCPILSKSVLGAISCHQASTLLEQKRKIDPKSHVVLSATAVTQEMHSFFSEIEDPRVQRTRAHLLTDILIIGILSVIAGGKGWEDMETYGLSKSNWLEQFLALPNGIPCPDTFRRVFERINPKVFERCFHKWVQSIVETVGTQVIPIDGKTLKGSYDREQGRSALHLVSAWASEHRLVLGQVKVSEKSNEITAIPALLELLDLAGCVITIDAMGTRSSARCTNI